MEDRTVRQADDPSLLARFFGIIFSPAPTFEKVVNNPKWLGMLVLASLLTAVPIGVFMFSAVGQEAWLDQVIESTKSWSGQVSEQQLQGFEKMAPYVGYIGLVQGLMMVPLFALVIGGIGFAVFSAGLGGTAAFKQVFAVVAHAGAIGAVMNLFVWPLNYIRGSMTSPTALASLLPFVDEGTFAFRLLRSLDLGIVWWVVVLAIGFAVLYRKKPAPVAAAFLSVYGVIAVVIAVVRS